MKPKTNGPWKSKDWVLTGFSIQTTDLVKVQNQQFRKHFFNGLWLPGWMFASKWCWWWLSHQSANSHLAVWDIFGQIVATSHDPTPKGSWEKGIPLFAGNLGGWHNLIWPNIGYPGLKGLLFWGILVESRTTNLQWHPLAGPSVFFQISQPWTCQRKKISDWMKLDSQGGVVIPQIFLKVP